MRGRGRPRSHRVRAAGIEQCLDHGQQPLSGDDQGRDTIRRGKLGAVAACDSERASSGSDRQV